jgi:DNA polymerase family A/RNase H-like protein
VNVVIDIETNGLINPTQIWVIVCKDIDTGEVEIFRKVTEDEAEKARFFEYASRVTKWIGHNILEFDGPVITKLMGFKFTDLSSNCIDTLILSRLVDYSRTYYQSKLFVVPEKTRRPGGSSQGEDPEGVYPGLGEEPRSATRRHSIESYGEEFGYPKIKFDDFSKYSKEMEDYCVRDVEISARIYAKYRDVITDPSWADSILLEHQFQDVVNGLHYNGFAFNYKKAESLLHSVLQDLDKINKEFVTAFPPKEVLVREFTPKLTKFGTISRTSVPRSLWPNMSAYEANQTYQHTRLEPFNPSSHKQVIAVLNDANWRPLDKTQTHIDTERELNRLRYARDRSSFDTKSERDRLITKLEKLKKTGFKINEANLNTLPATAPSPARLLAKYILLESRRRTLTEWLSLVAEDGRIHGRYLGIGAWTHRMAHQEPNTANIPNDLDINGQKKLLGKELRSLWIAPRKRLLVGVDAEGIQLRIFAHLIDDKEFTDALVKGKKADKTDPHSLNQRILGSVCATRAAAKRFIYALLLGAGLPKLAAILECSESECSKALDRLLERYTGWQRLREQDIPRDAKRGWFYGLDGRKITIPKATFSERKHLAMSGYLQSGEAIVMKLATLEFYKELKDEKALLVNLVHDEWQTETPNGVDAAIRVATMQASALSAVGESLKLKCPLAGSFYNDDLKDYTIGTNWSVTH